MLRQSSSRSYRSKKLRPSHSLQAVLLVAVGVWIVYQLAHSYGKQRVVAVQMDGEPARRWLGRKSFLDFTVGQASVDDIGVGGGSDAGRGADSSDDPLSKEGGDEEDEEDQEPEEDDGLQVDRISDDGLAADEEEDDRDLQSQNGSGEDELKTSHGETQNGLNTSIVPPGNTTVQAGVAVLLANQTSRAADGTALALSGSALKNTSSVDLSTLHARGTAGDVANKLPVASFAVGAPGAEHEKLQTNKNVTADSVAGHGIAN